MTSHALVFPPDLVLGVVNELLNMGSSTNDLKSCVLVSNLWRNVVQPLLFRDVIIRLYKPVDPGIATCGDGKPKTALEFLEFLRDSAHLASLIRHLTYRVSQERDFHYTDPCTFLNTLRQIPNLRSLQLFDVMFPSKIADLSEFFTEVDYTPIALKSLSLSILDNTHFRWEKSKPYASIHRLLLASGVFSDVGELEIIRANWGETSIPFKNVPEGVQVHSIAIHSWELKRSLKLMCTLNTSFITSLDLGSPTNESLSLALKQFFPLAVNVKHLTLKLDQIKTQDTLLHLLESTLKPRNLDSVTLRPLGYLGRVVESTTMFLRHVLKRVPAQNAPSSSRPLSIAFNIADQDVMGPPDKALGTWFPKVIQDLARTLEALHSTPETTRLQFVVKDIRQVKPVADDEVLEEVVLDEAELKRAVPSQYPSLLPFVSFDFVIAKT